MFKIIGATEIILILSIAAIVFLILRLIKAFEK